ncbi:MAG: sterol desaturase family protein [Gammaproteobacteria bacterium]|nr:sterol desaturase family protein [Gammaproteobacteria bacterium]
MNDFILSYELAIRLSAFLCVFAVMASWEKVAPRRKLLFSKLRRWLSNLGLVFLNTLLLRLIFPAAAVGMASHAATHGWGLFNAIQLPLWLVVPLSVILLDMVIYLQHVMVHAVPALWRLHRVHHADPDYDVTTGSRFHPIEIILSMLIKFATIAALGTPVLAVIILEVLLNGMAMFNHANVGLPEWLDRRLRWLLVTPDMHRVHHSQEVDESNSNFGFNLSIWDRLMGTYRAQPRLGHRDMVIGIASITEPQRTTHLGGMLMIPFTNADDNYSINRRSFGKSS